MALTARALPPVGHIVSRRLPGPDVVRAVALIGVVVMNFHGYLVLDDRNREGVGSDGRPSCSILGPARCRRGSRPHSSSSPVSA